MLDELKISQVAGYILSKERGHAMSILKLMKLLYFVDRESLLECGEPISYDNMVAMRHGMVLSNTYDLSSGSIKSIDNGWDSWISDREDHKVSLKRNIKSTDDFDTLSEFDINIINRVIAQYGQYGGFELAEMQHNPEICPEWSDPHGSSFSVSYEDILKKMGKSKDDISLSIKQIKEHNSLQSMFA